MAGFRSRIFAPAGVDEKIKKWYFYLMILKPTYLKGHNTASFNTLHPVRMSLKKKNQ